MINDLVSIIMPAYNSYKTIEKSIISVLNQTYQHWELIIVDDCSSDDTLEIIKKFSNDERVKFFKNNENCKAAITRNNALKCSKGQYIAFLDSDDIWVSNKLEKQINFMKLNNIGFSFTAYSCINEDGESIKREVFIPKNISSNKLLKNTIIGCSTVMIDRNVIHDFEFITNNGREDTFTWYLILKKGFIAYGINEILMNYRVYKTSSSSKKISMAKEYWRGLRDIAKLGFVKRIIYFSLYCFNAIKKRL